MSLWPKASSECDCPDTLPHVQAHARHPLHASHLAILQEYACSCSTRRNPGVRCKYHSSDSCSTSPVHLTACTSASEDTHPAAMTVVVVVEVAGHPSDVRFWRAPLGVQVPVTLTSSEDKNLHSRSRLLADA